MSRIMSHNQFRQTWGRRATAFLILAASLVNPVFCRAAAHGSSDESAVNLEIVPYFWLLGIDGRLSMLGLSIPLNINPLQLAGDANSAAGFEGKVRLGRGRWSVLADLSYGRLKFGWVPLPPVTILGFPIPLPAARISGDVLLVDLTGEYRLVAEPKAVAGMEGWRWTADGLLGLRAAKVLVDGGLALGGGTQLDDGWADPLMGIAFAALHDSGLRLNTRGLIGGFGASSDFTWSLETSAGYGFPLGNSLEGRLWAGYRILSLDRPPEPATLAASFDAVAHGPVIGIGAEF